MKKFLCIYHANCLDGFTSAWVVHRNLGDAADYHPGIYQEQPPDVRGREVILVDFSYKRSVIEKMMEDGAKRICILDHHVSSTKELESMLNDGTIYGSLDSTKSGCRLTWEWFYKKQPAPDVLLRVEDRDLFRFDYPNTNAVVAALASYQQSFEKWDELMNQPIDKLSSIGEHILRRHQRDVEAALDPKRIGRLNIAGHDVPAVNAPHSLASDVGHELAKNALFAPFAAVYWIEGNGDVVVSLRSNKVDGLNVATIAEKFGGGGHKNAAGFRTTVDVILSGFLP